MNEELRKLIDSLPPDAFQEDRNRFSRLSPIERLRWLQQTAWFIWKHKGAARDDAACHKAAMPETEAR